MKIGIITFHWAANYGAVLQAYALCEYLQDLGHDAEIINFYPPRYKKNIFRAIMTKHLKLIPKRIKEIPKEQEIEKFRTAYLRRSEYYSGNKKLKQKQPIYDCYICGSDQIWNMSFLRYGERRKTYTYFLDFAPKEKILASYAASFGTEIYADDLHDDIKKYLKRLDFVSVREKTGLDIVNGLGIYNACVVPDPTLLLPKQCYEKFLQNKDPKTEYAYSYMLHGRERDADILFKQLKKSGIDIVYSSNGGIENWLTEIYCSKIVITNSFHGVVFSIIFEKPFVAVLIEGSGMNDRILTLLHKLGLEDRIFNGDISIIHKAINWQTALQKLNQYRESGIDFLNKVLSYKKDAT